ncbi:MAG: class I SAM-dependent methyltransferase [Syntrophorhabdaceae bacterium]|nr:class I SAM-dependent methyltransferase [Syntrophorhabdaceae bacterium]
MFWFDKHNSNVLFCDNRTLEPTLLSNGATITVEPDVLVDVTDLPFPDESFWHIVFDPPHSTRAGANGWMSKKYGELPNDWKPFILDAFTELWRVLKPNGTLIFKWNEMHIPLSEIMRNIPPDIAACKLYGHRSGKQSKTHWVCFFKTERGRNVNG